LPGTQLPSITDITEQRISTQDAERYLFDHFDRVQATDRLKLSIRHDFTGQIRPDTPYRLSCNKAEPLGSVTTANPHTLNRGLNDYSHAI